MTQKNNQEQLFTAPATFLSHVHLEGPVTMRSLQGRLGFAVIPPGRVVGIVAGQVLKASNLDEDFTDSVMGIYLGGGYVASLGEVSIPGVFAFVVGAPVFLGDDGALTQVLPSEGFQLRMGLATGIETLMISIGEPIVLA